MTELLSYRPYQDSDFPGIKKLWAEEAHWGELTEDIWREWYVDIPNGPALIVVGVDGQGEPAAFATLTPYKFLCGEKEYLGVRLASNVIASRFHGSVHDLKTHPLLYLVLASRAQSIEQGYAAMFGMPKAAWMQMLRLGEKLGYPAIPRKKIACFELELASADVGAAPFVAEPLEAYGEEHEAMWREAHSQMSVQCAIQRDADTLNYRNGGHRNFEMRGGDGELLGYTAVRKDGLLFDIVARRPELNDELVRATAIALKTDGPERLKVLAADYFTDLPSMGFAKSDYKFGFVCHPLIEELYETMYCDNWYLAGGG